MTTTVVQPIPDEFTIRTHEFELRGNKYKIRFVTTPDKKDKFVALPDLGEALTGEKDNFLKNFNKAACGPALVSSMSLKQAYMEVF